MCFSGLDISAGASDQHCMHKNGTIISPVKQSEGVVQSKYDLFCSFVLMVSGGETTDNKSQRKDLALHRKKRPLEVCCVCRRDEVLHAVCLLLEASGTTSCWQAS